MGHSQFADGVGEGVRHRRESRRPAGELLQVRGAPAPLLEHRTVTGRGVLGLGLHRHGPHPERRRPRRGQHRRGRHQQQQLRTHAVCTRSLAVARSHSAAITADGSPLTERSVDGGHLTGFRFSSILARTPPTLVSPRQDETNRRTEDHHVGFWHGRRTHQKPTISTRLSMKSVEKSDTIIVTSHSGILDSPSLLLINQTQTSLCPTTE